MDKELQWLLDEKYNGKKTAAFYEDVKRIEAGEPLDYIIGFTEFLGCKIDVSKKPLIPRFETEFWTEEVIEELMNPTSLASFAGQNLQILDMFSGSGAIGVAIGKQVPSAHVTFADSEQNCIEQIAINCALNKLPAKRYEIVQSDIFKNIHGTFDVIVANPPYIPTTRAHEIQTSAIAHEPKPALFGGKEGLDFIEAFLMEAKKYMAPHGKLYMEFDSPQKPAIAKIIKKSGYTSHEFKKDQYDRWRYVEIIV